MRVLKLAVLVTLLVSFALVARPAMAGNANACTVDPPSGPVGTTFAIACGGFTPGGTTNIYAVEPDGRASGINIYGFFPTVVKADAGGVAAFAFITDFPALFSVPPGDYTFVVQQLGLAGAIAVEDHVTVTVKSKEISLVYASLDVSVDDYVASFSGSGFDAWEPVNIWVTPPPARNCSGLGIDQLTLGALGADGSSLWSGPGTVKADGAGNIAFTIVFFPSACIGEYHVTARALGSGYGAEAAFNIGGRTVIESGGAWITVTPNSVPANDTGLVISGYGFPAYTTLTCWFTRPDGRVLSFINANPKTDGGGSFATGAALDNFPPYTTTDPGTWYVTCATADHSYLAITWFSVFGLTSDP